MSLVVWTMMGIALWHFTVFLPDRFWGGIVGAFLASAIGAALFGFLVNGVNRAGGERHRHPAGAGGDPRCADRARALVLVGRPGRSRERHRPRFHARGLALAGRHSGISAGASPPVPSASAPRMGRMQSRSTRWESQPYDVAVAGRLAGELGVSRIVGAILARRGFADSEDARRFLAAEQRHDPLGLPGVPAACELILDHLRRGSRIAVFGDYDVDGVCSTAMLVRALRALGGDPAWELPSRFDEGYGLSGAAVERLTARGTALLVTVDCGITAVEQVAAAEAAGLDVVVTDHHRPGPELPDCVVVHPALGAYACPELCASGVVLKLSEALHGAAGGDPGAASEDLDLAALATVCDLVPLRDENRRIAREGVLALSRTRKPGLRALVARGRRGAGGADRARISASGSARGSTRRGGCGARTPRSSCCSPRTEAAPRRSRASSTCSTATAARRRRASCPRPRRPASPRRARAPWWWPGRAGIRAWSGSLPRGWSSAGGAPAS